MTLSEEEKVLIKKALISYGRSESAKHLLTFEGAMRHKVHSDVCMGIWKLAHRFTEAK